MACKLRTLCDQVRMMLSQTYHATSTFNFQDELVFTCMHRHTGTVGTTPRDTWMKGHVMGDL
jgi:hypothetical protein